MTKSPFEISQSQDLRGMANGPATTFNAGRAPSRRAAVHAGEVPGVVRRVDGEAHPFEKQARRIRLMARAVPRPDTRSIYEMN
jgi:hypothetical protein